MNQIKTKHIKKVTYRQKKFDFENTLHGIVVFFDKHIVVTGDERIETIKRKNIIKIEKARPVFDREKRKKYYPSMV